LYTQAVNHPVRRCNAYDPQPGGKTQLAAGLGSTCDIERTQHSNVPESSEV
jgi:hypothetical protein